MREFLFRGKRKVDGEWVVGDSILRFRDGGTFIVCGGSVRVSGTVLNALMDSVFVEVVPETVEVFRGEVRASNEEGKDGEVERSRDR